MTREGVIEKICEFIRLQMGGAMGHIRQNPYRDEFFEVFKQAYRNGYFSSSPKLHVGYLRDIILARVSHQNKSDEERLLELINQFSVPWEEWYYAWEHYEN